jgi:hypothetical protein
MTRREIEEYRALRTTILQRGTARHWTVLAGLGLWSAMTIAVATLGASPVVALLPLVTLAAAFEVAVSLNLGVERVGRYVEVFFESPGDEAAWEQTSMAYGRSFKGGGIDALFSPLFFAAALLNFLVSASVGPVVVEWVVIAGAHLLFVWRIWRARGQARGQRALELDRYQRLKHERHERPQPN